jgi:hypothetical protein
MLQVTDARDAVLMPLIFLVERVARLLMELHAILVDPVEAEIQTSIFAMYLEVEVEVPRVIQELVVMVELRVVMVLVVLAARLVAVAVASRLVWVPRVALLVAVAVLVYWVQVVPGAVVL